MLKAIVIGLALLAGCANWDRCSTACSHLAQLGCDTSKLTCERICHNVAANDERFVGCIMKAKSCGEADACDGG